MSKIVQNSETSHSQSLCNEISAIFFFGGDMMHYRPPTRHFGGTCSRCSPRDLRHCYKPSSGRHFCRCCLKANKIIIKFRTSAGTPTDSLYEPSLASVLSRMPAPMHGTQRQNTSVLNLTFVFLGNC